MTDKLTVKGINSYAETSPWGRTLYGNNVIISPEPLNQSASFKHTHK